RLVSLCCATVWRTLFASAIGSATSRSSSGTLELLWSALSAEARCSRAVLASCAASDIENVLQGRNGPVLGEGCASAYHQGWPRKKEGGEIRGARGRAV